MAVKYFESDFRCAAKRSKGRVAAGGKAQFFAPDIAFISLSNCREISGHELHEKRVGPFLEVPIGGWFGTRLGLVLGDQRILNEKLIKSVLLHPEFQEKDGGVRHIHGLASSKNSGELIPLNGRAYFQMEVPEPKAPQVMPPERDLPRTTLLGGTELVQGGDGLTRDVEVAVETAPRPMEEWNNRVVPVWNKWLNILLFLIGLGFLGTVPMLGMALLSVPLYRWSRASGTSTPTTGMSWLLGLVLTLLVVGAFFVGSPWAWPLLFAGFLMALVQRGGKRSWLVLGGILFALFAILAYLPLLQTRLQEDTTEGDGRKAVRIKKERKEGDNRVTANHWIEWAYPQKNQLNTLEYRTSEEEFAQSLETHREVSGLQAKTEDEFWQSAYQMLLKNDQKKVDSVALVVRKVSKQRRYNPAQTAEYLVTMIQEVPYVLVHDLSCKDAVLKYRGFVAQYHMQGKECLPDVVAGVQSPYEFMHNLKGDCDTRTLFAHAVLNRLGISSSVWVSSTYGHSILGVGVPGSSSNRKVIQGVPHYAVELTAKNFRIGMIAPDQNQMSNWKVAIYTNF
jgi:hypothetical protein